MDHAEAIGTRTLWSVQIQVGAGEEGPWIAWGTETADPAAVLRTYDYRTEHFPGEKCRIVRTVVQSYDEDIDGLRAVVEEKAAREGVPGLQSE